MFLTRQSLDPAERRLYAQARQMLTRPGLIRGSLVVLRRQCGKAACRCARFRRHWHRSLVLKIGENGKQRTIYVPSRWEDRVRSWVAQYVEIRKVLERLSRACVKRVERQEL